MKIIDIEQGSEEWMDYRKGKISGTLLGALYSKKGNRKIGFYEMIAERLSLDADDENPMDRGLRLEDEAIEEFTKKTGKKVERVGVCVHDKYPQIINSPDGLIKIGDKYKEAIEIKCLSSARHLQAVIDNYIDPHFEAQVIQYFIVNPDLWLLHFVFYDPRVTSKPLHIIEVSRDDLGDKPKQFLEFQLEQLKEINKIVEEMAF